MDHGLNAEQLQRVKSIFAKYAPHIEKVGLFGSRAKGHYNKHSDIDFVIYGDIDEDKADRLWAHFNESQLPYKVDISVYKHISYPPLKRHIDRCSKILFTKSDLDLDLLLT